jgi:hypothetical protein
MKPGIPAALSKETAGVKDRIKCMSALKRSLSQNNPVNRIKGLFDFDLCFQFTLSVCHIETLGLWPTALVVNIEFPTLF